MLSYKRNYHSKDSVIINDIILNFTSNVPGLSSNKSEEKEIDKYKDGNKIKYNSKRLCFDKGWLIHEGKGLLKLSALAREGFVRIMSR